MKRIVAMLLCSALVITLAVFAAPKSVKSDDTVKPSDYSEVYKTISKLQKSSVQMLKNAGIMYEAENSGADIAAADAPAAKDSYYGTNVQVEGIDEADIVKTDGEYIYAIKDNTVLIYRAAGENTCHVKTLAISDEENAFPSEIYLSDGRLVVICNYGLWCDGACCDVAYNAEEKTEIYVFDVSKPESAALIHKLAQDGNYNTSRLFNGKLYMITNYFVYDDAVENDLKTYIPATYNDGVETLVPSDCIAIMPEANSTSYCVCAAYDVSSCELIDTESILGGCNQTYMSENAIYLTKSEYDEEVSEEYEKDGYTVTDHKTKNYTDIYRIGFENGLDLTASGRVEGYIDSQFSLDEYKGNLRVVTTNNYDSYSIYTDKKHKFENYEWHDSDVRSDNALYILDNGLNEVSSVTGLAENEYVYSVRFDGDFVYFCTFRQTDPLFAVNMTNVKKPEIVSEYKINGFSDYLHVWDDGLLFGLGMEANDEGRTSGLKMVMFDVSDKADVKALNFTVLDENYTEALYNHKALLIIPEKNLIAFQCGDSYCVFSYTADGFALKQKVSLPVEWGQFRGVLIGDYIYAVYNSGLSVISLNDFSTVTSINIST